MVMVVVVLLVVVSFVFGSLSSATFRGDGYPSISFCID